MNYCQVAVNYPREPSILTYKIPEGLKLEIGHIVKVPLGRRNELGCVLEFSESYEGKYKVREVIEVAQDTFRLSLDEIKLYVWVAKYYMYPVGKMIFDCMPKYLKRIKEPTVIQGRGVKSPFEYNDEQLEIINSIDSFKDFQQGLIHGVTGSGKSLIFLECIRKKIAEGKSVQYLLPEINLTPQFTKFFSEFLDCPIYTYNSSVAGSQKFNLWRKVKELDKASLFIGVRSSIYLPIKNLGMIVIDEEHDKSFKQDDRCRYHARNVAIKKSQILNIPIIMASATPTVDTYHRYQTNDKLHYFTLEKRFNDSKLPELKIVPNENYKSDKWPLNEETLKRIETSLESGFQCIVFINKLGFSRYVQCRNCGHTFDCPNCDVKLTQFKSRGTIECYSCEYQDRLPSDCPECSCVDLMQGGYGTEKIENLLKELFPNKKIARFDRDEVKKLSDVEEKLESFANKEIDILVGTQMLSKGHNFKNVDTIVILGVDHLLHRPDYKANEDVYQQVVQVSGRAGRFGEDAVVYIQSDIEPKVFEYIKEHTFHEFYQDELKVREVLNFPPYVRMMKIEGVSRDEDELYTYLRNLKNDLKDKHGVDVHGPVPEFIKKRSNKYYYSLILKGSRLRINSSDRRIEIRSHVDI